VGIERNWNARYNSWTQFAVQPCTCATPSAAKQQQAADAAFTKQVHQKARIVPLRSWVAPIGEIRVFVVSTRLQQAAP
jgi:hypothetical protein